MIHAGRAFLWFAPLVLFSLISLEARADVASRSFTETFDTNEFKGLSSPADWDTIAGELRLLPFTLSHRSSYDTAGDASDIVIEGNRAYVADGASGVQILNVQFTTPTPVGSYVTPGGAAAIDIEGDLAFVADKGSGLAILDVSNPATPTWVGGYDTAGFAYDVAVAGYHAYVANNNQPASVVDVSNPAAPVQVATLPTTSFAQGIAVEGALVFIADGYSGLAIFDVSDPTTPVAVGTIDTSGFARNVVVSGNIAYVADFTAGLQVIDVTTPAVPVQLATFATAQPTVGLSVDGDWLYLASTSSVFVLDIQDPSFPTQIYDWSSPGDAEAVAISGEHAFVADGAVGGIQVLDVADLLSSPLDVYTYSVGLTCTPVVSGDYAYVGRRDGLISVEYKIVSWEMTDPGFPRFRGSRTVTDIPVDMAIAGDRLYVAMGNAGLGVYSLFNPTFPSGGPVYDPGSFAQEVAVAGATAFVSSSDGSLHAINSTSYGLRDVYPLPESALDLVLDGNFLYAPCRDSGLQIIDVRNPASMAFVGQYVPTEPVFSVDVEGNLAYVACSDGLHVVDLTNPASPTQVTFRPMAEAAEAIAVIGNNAIVATPSGLDVFGVSYPTSPFLLGRTSFPLDAREMVVYGDHLMVGEYGFSQGMTIFRIADRSFDNTRNIGFSTIVANTPSDIHRARILSDQDEGARWQLSVDGGFNFEAVPELGVWTQLQYSGHYLNWLATLVPGAVGVNPTVREVTIDWLYDPAVIESVADVPGDQGGFVRLNFTRSGHDFADESTYPALTYDVYRRVDDPQLKAKVTSASGEAGIERIASQSQAVGLPTLRLDGREFLEAVAAKAAGFPPGTWEAVASLGALQSDSYLSLLPTLADSAATLQQSVFTIVTHTTTPSVWYVSAPDSGYSVDNIAPGAPQGMSASYSETGTTLDWQPAVEPDFQYYRVYRGLDEGFVPSPTNLVHSTASAGWIDTVADPWKFRYKLTALDHAGNESDAASPDAVTAVDTPAFPSRFALHPNVPNPFNPRTTIRFDVPEGRHHVRIVVYDAAGRAVRTLVNGPQDGGQRTVLFDGEDDAGRPVATGMYFFRLEAGDTRETRKMTLLR